MAKCCIPLCPRPSNLTCYPFPRNDIKRRQQWISSINSEDLYIFETSLALHDKAGVCSLHFKPNDYVFHFGDDQTSKREINEDAVPSIFPWTNDWFSNYMVEMEIASKLSNGNSKDIVSPTTSTSSSGLPEGDAVEIGNVESLGINTQVSEKPQQPVFSEDVKCPNPEKLLKKTPTLTSSTYQAKSNSESSPLNSDDSNDEISINKSVKLQLTYNFSCVDCNFKTTNPIFLKEHRVKSHPPQKKSGSTVNKNLLDAIKPTTPISQPKQPFPYVLKQTVTSCGRTVTSYFNREKRHIYFFCTVCHHTTTNTQRLLQHLDKEHPELQEIESPLEKYTTSAAKTFTTSTPQISKLPQVKQHSIVRKSPKNQTTSNSNVSKILRKTSTPEAIIEELAEKNITKARIDKRWFYFCPRCAYKTHDRERVLKHLDLHHPQAPSTPDSTKPIVEKEKEVSRINIMESSGERKKYPCQWCDFQGSSRPSLISHEKKHFSNSAVKCHLCTYTSNQPKAMRHHVTRDHRNDCNRASHLKSSSSESDIEHLCRQCNFKTFSQKLFAIHERIHDSSGSSTDELLSVGVETEERVEPTKERKAKKSPSKNSPLIERLVYHCPTCNYWAGHFRTFHEHVAGHENSPAFKCSECDFTSRSRRSITKHIQKSLKGSHESASWVSLTPPSEEQYAKYLKPAMVPKDASSGRCKRFDENPLENESKTDEETSASPSASDNSNGSLHEWVPSENSLSSEIEDSFSSSLSYIMTPASSSYSEDKDRLSSPSFVVSDPKTDDDEKKTRNKRNASSSPTPILTRSAVKEHATYRKRRRIESDEENNDSQSPKISSLESREIPNQPEEGTSTPSENKLVPLDIIEKQDSSNILFYIKPTFPAIEEALSKCQEDQQTMANMQMSLETMRMKLQAMEKADEAGGLELVQLNERKESINAQLMKLNGQKIEAELQVRMEQCQELKLSLALYEPQQLSQETKKALDDCKVQVAEFQAKLDGIVKDIANTQLEQENVSQQIKEVEESRASGAQLMDIMKSELAEAEIELQNFQQEFAGSNSHIKELVNNERNLIKAQAACWEAELKASYMRTLSKIRQKEREWLNSLDHVAGEKRESPPHSSDQVL